MNTLNPSNLDLNDPNVVKINGNVINSTAPENVSLNASDSEFIYINMNVDSISTENANQLNNLGVQIKEYISDHTYMARYRNSDLSAIRQLPFVRAANVYAPSLKTVGSIQREILNNLSHIDYKVVVQLHPDAPQSVSQVSQEISNRLNLNLLQLVTSNSKIELTVHKDQLINIAGIDSVKRIEEYLEVGAHNEYARGVLGANWDYSSFGDGRDYYRWKGRGQVVCVADSGVDVSHRAFTDRIHSEANLNEPYKSTKPSIDPNGHGTHVAGSVAEGVAQECKIMVQGMLKEGGGNSFFGTDTMYTDAFQAGAHVHTNSWGPSWEKSQNDYNYSAELMDSAVWNWNGRVICVSAGNDGGKSNWSGEIGGSNAAKNAICVGNGISLRPNDGNAYDANCPFPDARAISRYSSTGYTLPAGKNIPGRIKPDVIAPGTAILSCKSASMTEANAKGYDAYGYSWRKEYCYSSGTSMSTPHVAGCCAVIREALVSPLGGGFTNNEPGGMLIKALLINGCVDLKGHYGGGGSTKIIQAPSTWQGHGRVDLTNSLLHIERYLANDPGSGFMDAGYNKPYDWCRPLYQGDSYKSPLYTCKAKVFSVTMAYYDPPGPLTQNQLNLIVYNGTGTANWWYGNKWSRKTGFYDQSNNVEKVVWVKEDGDSDSFWFEVVATRIAVPGNNQSYAVAWLSHE